MAGEAFLGIATTEPEGGSDILGTCRTKAVQQGDSWVLNGEKMYISGVRESLEMGGVHLLLARTDPDPEAEHKAFTFFALPLQGTPGITPTYFEDMGRMGISTGGFALEDVGLPDAHRVGDVNRGFYHAMEGFSAARVLIGATCVGASEAVLEMGMEHVKERQAFGRPLAAYEGIPSPWPITMPTWRARACWSTRRRGRWIKSTAPGPRTHYDIALAAALAKLRAPQVAFPS